jgi:colicin import membrane protein
MKEFGTVFECYPGAEELFIVNDQPFLDKSQAENYARGIDAKVIAIKRADAKPDKADAKAKAEAKAEADAKAKAEADAKAKAEADAKAKAEADKKAKAEADKKA